MIDMKRPQTGATAGAQKNIEHWEMADADDFIDWRLELQLRTRPTKLRTHYQTLCTASAYALLLHCRGTHDRP